MIEVALEAEYLLIPAHGALESIHRVRTLIELAGFDEDGQLLSLIHI